MQYETLQVTGAAAIQTLKDLRSTYRSTGKYPFLIGDAEDLVILQENSEDSDTEFEEIVQSSSKVGIHEYVERQKNADRQRGTVPPLGNWPRVLPEERGLTIHTKIVIHAATATRKLKPQVYLGVAEIAEPWQLPAVVAFGGWNDCPWSDVHCAFHREWQQSHGAEIAGISGSVIECFVSNPPCTQADALRLAWQQYYYCRDIVEQGCESINQLAATLINAPMVFLVGLSATQINSMRSVSRMSKHIAKLEWKKNGPSFLKGQYSREHTWTFDGGITVAASASPSVVSKPWSNPANVDPEEALVAAIASCHMLTFLWLASKQGFEIESYVDEAVGEMTKNERGVFWVSVVNLHPQIVYGGEKRPTAEEEAQLHHRAHEECFIANSVKTEVVVHNAGHTS